MIYHVDGQDYHVRFTGNNTTFRKDDVNKDFGLLLPFSISSTNIDYVYQFEMQNDGSYLIRQNGNALIMCKKYPVRNFYTENNKLVTVYHGTLLVFCFSLTLQ